MDHAFRYIDGVLSIFNLFSSGSIAHRFDVHLCMVRVTIALNPKSLLGN